MVCRFRRQRISRYHTFPLRPPLYGKNSRRLAFVLAIDRVRHRLLPVYSTAHEIGARHATRMRFVHLTRVVFHHTIGFPTSAKMWHPLESIEFWTAFRTRPAALRRTLPSALITAICLFGVVASALAAPDIPV